MRRRRWVPRLYANTNEDMPGPWWKSTESGDVRFRCRATGQHGGHVATIVAGVARGISPNGHITIRCTAPGCEYREAVVLVDWNNEDTRGTK